MKVKSLIAVVLACCSVSTGYAQEKKHFHLSQDGDKKKINLTVNASSVLCKINSTYNFNPVNIYGYPKHATFNPVKYDQVQGKVRNIEIDFCEDPNKGVSSSLSSKVFYSTRTSSESPWHMYLSRDAVFDLNLRYGMGSAAVDLSDMAVEKLKISTGSANVKVGYQNGLPNKTQMDTLHATVDLGTLQIDNLNLSNAREVIADVGFGNLLMQFSEDCKYSSNISASVGAGTLEVLLDDSATPVIIRISESPLCGIKMPNAFEEIEPNTFINDSYRADVENLLSFDVSVAMGNVIFKTKE